MRTQRTHDPLTHTTYKTLRQTKYTPSGSGLPQQGAWWHNPNCYGTTPGVWQRAQGVDLASESPRSWSDGATVGCAGQSPIWGGSILQSCRTHRIPPSKDALHGLILWVLQLARSDTPRLVLEHPMDWYLARWIPWTLFFCTVLQGTHSQWGMPWGGCVWMDGSCKEALIWMPGPS